jgi:phosphoribosyl 1,2-cyclic phosphodiesterase
LVDAGCSMRQVKNSLLDFDTSIEKIDAIFVSHEHHDHISKVAQLSRRFDIPVYASIKTWRNLPFYDDYFPWERHIFEYGMKIGEMCVDFFRLSHDAVEPCGFVFGYQGKRVGIATDTGLITSSMLRQLADVDGLVFEANHDCSMLRQGSYPAFLKHRVAGEYGHLSNDQAVEALSKLVGINTQQIILAHLSEQNNCPKLAYRAVRTALDRMNLDIAVSVAPGKTAHPLVAI